MISTISQNLSNLFNQNYEQPTKTRQRYSESPHRFGTADKVKTFNRSAPSFSHSDDENFVSPIKSDLNRRNTRNYHVCFKIIIIM